MPLEATIIIVDNSEHARNGDYLPSRFEAQSDAVNLLFSAKTNANPESSVGLMTMGGTQPEVLTTLTSDFGKMLDGLHRTKIHGNAHFSTALNVAQLALKHRQNKSQHQRVILFTCSPLGEETTKSMEKLAKRMKKNTINVDVVAFGDLDADNTAKIEAFHENIKGSADGSHLAVIPPGPNLLSDSIVATAILAGDGYGGGGGGGGEGGEFGGEGGGGGGGGGENHEFGVDPNMDPELALALRMSMEEEERRRTREEGPPKEEGQKLESVPEEGASSSGGGGAGGEEGSSESGEKKDGDKKDDEAGDKMDTA